MHATTAKLCNFGASTHTCCLYKHMQVWLDSNMHTAGRRKPQSHLHACSYTPALGDYPHSRVNMHCLRVRVAEANVRCRLCRRGVCEASIAHNTSPDAAMQLKGLYGCMLSMPGMHKLTYELTIASVVWGGLPGPAQACERILPVDHVCIDVAVAGFARPSPRAAGLAPANGAHHIRRPTAAGCRTCAANILAGRGSTSHTSHQPYQQRRPRQHVYNRQRHRADRGFHALCHAVRIVHVSGHESSISEKSCSDESSHTKYSHTKEAGGHDAPCWQSSTTCCRLRAPPGIQPDCRFLSHSEIGDEC